MGSHWRPAGRLPAKSGLWLTGADIDSAPFEFLDDKSQTFVDPDSTSGRDHRRVQSGEAATDESVGCSRVAIGTGHGRPIDRIGAEAAHFQIQGLELIDEGLVAAMRKTIVWNRSGQLSKAILLTLKTVLRCEVVVGHADQFCGDFCEPDPYIVLAAIQLIVIRLRHARR